MIVIDYQPTAIAALYASSGGKIEDGFDPGLVRHIILNSIRSTRVRLRARYGETVIACDHTDNWRKKVFPYYKARRAEGRDASPVDWGEVFRTFDEVRAELEAYSHYRVVRVEGCEADDVIGTLIRDTEDEACIVSTDRDFIQLHRPGIVQWDPRKHKHVGGTIPPRVVLKEKIIRGDPGDGVPNFLSDDDCFVVRKKQKSIFAAKVARWLEQTPEEICGDDERLLRNWKRNEVMIDLSRTPESLQAAIRDKYAGEAGKKNRFFEYMVQFRLRNLTEHLSDFE